MAQGPSPHSAARPSDEGGPGSPQPPLVTPAQAFALIAKQPALLSAPLPQLLARCHELALALRVQPSTACTCLARLPPRHLHALLAAPWPAVQGALRRLAGALALSQLDWGLASQPAPYPPPAAVSEEPASSGGPAQTPRRSVSSGSASLAGVGRADHRLHSLASRPTRIVVSTARSAVVRCPTLLLTHPTAVRESAAALRRQLRLSGVRALRLVARKPAVLLVPPRRRAAALAALATELRLPEGLEHAARLAAQQPQLLGWEREGVRARLEQMALALGLKGER